MTSVLDITQQIFDCQEFFKKLWKDAYDSEMADVRAILRGVANEEFNGELMSAAMHIGKRMDESGHDPAIIFAALVDCMEADSRTKSKV